MKRAMSQKKRMKKLAQRRIATLWEQALAAADSSPDLAKRWVFIARRVAQRARVRLPINMRRKICKICGIVFVPGRNCRIRVRNNRSTHITVTCLCCGAIRRYPVAREP